MTGRHWCGVASEELLEKFLLMLKESPQEDKDESHHLSMDSWSIGYEPATQKRYADFV